MSTTIGQWVKTNRGNFSIDGDDEWYASEYTNAFTGWVIRKQYGNGLANSGSWIIFDNEGTIRNWAHSLTWAKCYIENEDFVDESRVKTLCPTWKNGRKSRR